MMYIDKVFDLLKVVLNKYFINRRFGNILDKY